MVAKITKIDCHVWNLMSGDVIVLLCTLAIVQGWPKVAPFWRLSIFLSQIHYICNLCLLIIFIRKWWWWWCSTQTV